MPCQARLDIHGALHHIRRHRRTGHLYENRYKSILCEEDGSLIRYIHLNPIRARIVKTMETLDSYPWSGHSVIMGKNKREWTDAEYVLTQFGGSGNRKAFGCKHICHFKSSY